MFCFVFVWGGGEGVAGGRGRTLLTLKSGEKASDVNFGLYSTVD